MKKLNSAQQARLDVLNGQGSHTDIEAAELASLLKLSGDTAEEPEVEEEEEAPDPAAEESDAPAPEEEAPEEEASGPTLTIWQKANAALNSKKVLVGQADTATAELQDARSEIVTLKAKITALEEEAKQGRALAARVAELEHDASTVSASAARIAASNHVSEEDLPEASGDAVTAADHAARLSELSGRERTAYFRENREAIRAAEATGLN